MPDTEIGGTVIQRSFVPRGLGVVINVATVPLDELVVDGSPDADSDFLRNFTAELLGTPRHSIIDQSQYQLLDRLFSDGDFFERLATLATDPLSYEWNRYYFQYWRDYLSRKERAAPPRRRFVQDFLSLLARPVPVPVGNTPFTFGPWPSFISRERLLADSREFRELHLSTEGFQAGLACIYSGVDAEDRVREFTSTLENYEIPIGQSPKVKAGSLLQMIDTGKQLCLAPLLAGGTIGIGQLQQASYIGALLTVGTGAGMTLMLIGTLSVGDYLVRYLMHKRPPVKPENNRRNERSKDDDKEKGKGKKKKGT